MGELFVLTDGVRGGARSTLAGVRALEIAGHRSVVAVLDPCSMVVASRYCDSVAVVPHHSSPDYANVVRSLCAERGAVGILPGSDASLLALGAPVEELIDKACLSRRAVTAGFSVPPTETIADKQELLSRAGELDYPIVLKMRASRVRARRIDRKDDLETLPGEGPFVVQPFLDGPMMAVAGMLREGRLVAVMRQRYLRTWPVDCGTSCAAISVEGDPSIERRLPTLLEGYEGIFQVQFRDGHLIDVNPRIYGSLPLAVGSGVNLAALQADLLAGRPAPLRLLRGRTGVRYRWIDGDLRHLMTVVRSGRPARALSGLFPRRGTVHSIWRWRDPRPALVRLRAGLGRSG